MQSFTRVLHVEDRGFLHFSFNCILTPQKQKCQVTVISRGPKSYYFEMEENHGHWRIVSAPQPPQWILELESRLRQVINDEQVLYAIKAERQSARLQNPA